MYDNNYHQVIKVFFGAGGVDTDVALVATLRFNCRNTSQLFAVVGFRVRRCWRPHQPLPKPTEIGRVSDIKVPLQFTTVVRKLN